MKKVILGTFTSRPGAEILIEHLRRDLRLPQDDITYICRDANGEVFEVIDGDDFEVEGLSARTKRGVLIGGAVGSLLGIGVLYMVLPIILPFFTTHPTVFAVGLSISSIGGIVLSGFLGAILGGTIASMSEPNGGEGLSDARQKRDDVLVVAHARDEKQVGQAFAFYGATGVEVYTPTLT